MQLFATHGLYSPWSSPGQNTGVGSHSLLQGIFPIKGSNPGLPHCRRILYQLSHKGSPRILEWVAYPFLTRSSWVRNRTGISCIAAGLFTNWAIREAPMSSRILVCFLLMVQWVKNSHKCNAGDTWDTDLIPALGRLPGGGNDNLAQYSYWKIQWTENPGGLQSKGSESQPWLRTHALCTPNKLGNFLKFPKPFTAISF